MRVVCLMQLDYLPCFLSLLFLLQWWSHPLLYFPRRLNKGFGLIHWVLTTVMAA